MPDRAKFTDFEQQLATLKQSLANGEISLDKYIEKAARLRFDDAGSRQTWWLDAETETWYVASLGSEDFEEASPPEEISVSTEEAEKVTMGSGAKAETVSVPDVREEMPSEPDEPISVVAKSESIIRDVFIPDQFKKFEEKLIRLKQARNNADISLDEYTEQAGSFRFDDETTGYTWWLDAETETWWIAPMGTEDFEQYFPQQLVYDAKDETRSNLHQTESTANAPPKSEEKIQSAESIATLRIYILIGSVIGIIIFFCAGLWLVSPNLMAFVQSLDSLDLPSIFVGGGITLLVILLVSAGKSLLDTFINNNYK